MTDFELQLEAEALRLFEDALDQPSPAREQWIVDRTAENDDLRARVMKLLRADQAGQSLVTGGALSEFDAEETPPKSVGQYKVIRLLGRGGMGAVWLGERAAGDFDHRVAIKVVRGVSRSPRLAERLRYERQTLAALQHPNIAQLFDGGETDTGEPYFIMEYVEGAPIGDALEAAIDAEERLRIFREICSAVEYAHQKLIVHRDLSPANILLTGDGRVKLIDFGISRSFSDKGADGPQLTMTKGFAAPERVKGEPATTLSDIYSLGLILRDMLQAMPVMADLDLAAISEKASAHEQDERYQSVTALIADLDRYASGRAVEARGTNGLYAFGKFIRRRRFAVGAGALAAFGVVAALVVTSTLYAQAEAERREADARFAQVRELANFMLFDLYDQLGAIPGTTKALSGIADKSRSYLDALKDNKRASQALRLETALGYKRLGDVTGNPIGANLGRREEAGSHLSTAIASLQAMHDATPGDADIARALAQTSYSMAVYQFIAIDDNEAAAQYASDAGMLYAGIIASGQGTDRDEIARIDARAQSGKPLVWDGKGEESIAILTQARDEAEAFAKTRPDNAAAQSLSATTNVALAEATGRHFDLIGGGDYTSAVPPLDRAIDIYHRLDTANPDDMNARRNLVSAHFKRALIYYSMEDDDQVLADLTAAEEIADEFLAKDPDDLGMKRTRTSVIEQKAMTLAYMGRFEEAFEIGEGNLQVERALLAGEPDNPARVREVASTTFMLGEMYRLAENTRRACALFAESKANYRRLETDFTLSDYDRETGLNPLEEYLSECV
ncbi:serine/threonine protein kinase [Hyphococcus sp.]|uniref:serine/threonine protein kinase n=1 Tax=Hyphococcus sp. TaxID=2038636 RepID=UPI00207EC66D|nr:MAG: hypothetical protein DHS20C04_09580 [Marinicaulis sp.]